jgi:hypothetical protein
MAVARVAGDARWRLRRGWRGAARVRFGGLGDLGGRDIGRWSAFDQLVELRVGHAARVEGSAAVDTTLLLDDTTSVVRLAHGVKLPVPVTRLSRARDFCLGGLSRRKVELCLDRRKARASNVWLAELFPPVYAESLFINLGTLLESYYHMPMPMCKYRKERHLPLSRTISISVSQQLYGNDH